MFELETNSLLLRGWRSDDAEQVINFYADPNMSKYVGGPRDTDTAWCGMATMIGHWQLKGFGYWAVEEKKSAAFVGCVGLWQSPGWPKLELGYWLLEEFHGKGYAKEAAARCLQYARDDMQADSVVSYIDPENIPSIKLAESLGAQAEQVIELAGHGPHRIYRHF